MNKDYIKWIRSKVGHEKVILIFSGGCVFNDYGEVLLQRRGDSGKWGFPGGAIELGETPEEACIRELKEETGLDVDIESLIGVYSDGDMKYRNGDEAHCICVVYRLKQVGGNLKCDNLETVELKFFKVNDLPEMFCKQHEEIKETLKKQF